MLVAKSAGDLWGDELGNIDVFAQKAIVRLSRNHLTSPDAHTMLDAVKSRELRGIFIENQKVPALRAQKLGTWYGKLIPTGEDAVIVPAPTGSTEPPLIAFRDSVKTNATRLDAALLKAWSTYKLGLATREPRCGVPPIALHALRKHKWSEPQLQAFGIGLEAPPQKVEPKLCLYQNESSSVVELFKNQASRWAREIGALAIPPNLDVPPSHLKVGPTPYSTGIDIRDALDATYWILNEKPVKEVHIFGHMYGEGIIGRNSNFTGAYRNDPVIRRERNCSPSGCRIEEKSNKVNRDAGGIVASEIRPNPLAQDVVFVLHGCNSAAGDHNFARALYEHLSTSLQNPSVYGHYVSVCAGQDGCWREYSDQSKKGELRSKTIPSFYRGHGLCMKAVEIAKKERRCNCCP
jgi:hypothetical protein